VIIHTKEQNTTMPFEIPKEDQGAVVAITKLPDAALERLITALSSAPPISNPAEMKEHIAKELPAIESDKLEHVIEVLYTLYFVRELSGVSPSRFLADLMDGIRKTRPELRDTSKLESQFNRLLNIETLLIIAKAARLQRDSERLYCEAKIISDMRPVFGSNPNVRPAGAVLIHTLRIHYHEGRDQREIHLALDSDDLSALAEVVRRAQAKDRVLRTVLKKSKLPNLGE
jgi:hypothetical protein